MCKVCRQTPVAKPLMAELAEIAQQMRELGLDPVKELKPESAIKTPSTRHREQHRLLYRRLDRVRVGLSEVHRQWKETLS